MSFKSTIEHDPSGSVGARVFLTASPSVYAPVHESVAHGWREKEMIQPHPLVQRPPINLIREMAAENTAWGEERIANELKLKLGIRVSPRTVKEYLGDGGPTCTPDPKQRWLTFIHNHAKFIVACSASASTS
jgi:hypothetical protein